MLCSKKTFVGGDIRSVLSAQHLAWAADDITNAIAASLAALET